MPQSFPQRYTGTCSHPDVLKGKEIEITVVRQDKSKGTLSFQGETQKIDIKEEDGKIGFGDGTTELIGTAESSGVIKGEVTQDGKKGGKFTLTPQDECSAGSPVNAARKLRTKGAPGDEYRALSVWFIVNKLMDDLKANDDSKVYNVEPRIREKGAEVECPRDGKKGTAYVDVAEDPYAGYATHMLSYTWGYYLKEIKDTLLRFCQDGSLDIKEVRVWMCFACVNQHRVKEAQKKGEVVPFEAFKKIFGERVQNIGHILPMMSPWNAPFYITRVWCCFEIFTAVNLGPEKCQVTVLLPPKQSSDFSEAFDKGAEKMVFKALRSIDVENAQASMPEDKEQILRLIKEGPGYHQVNTQVVKHLRSWFMLQACRNEVERLCKLGQVYTTFGEYDAGIDMLQKAMSLLDKLDDGKSPLFVRVLISFAEAEFSHKFYGGDSAAADIALERYKDAQELIKNLGMEETELAVMLINKKGITLREKTNSSEDDDKKPAMYKKGLEELKKGRDILEKLGMSKCVEAMWNRFIAGLMLSDLSEKHDPKAVGAAKDMYKEAIDMGKALEYTQDEYYVKGIHAYGIFMMTSLEETDNALEYLLEAKEGYEALGLTESVFYMMAAFQTGLVFATAEEKRDIKKAAASLQDSIEAAEASGKTEIIDQAKSMLEELCSTEGDDE